MPLPAAYQAIRFYQPRDLRLDTLPLPQPAAGELLLRIGSALTCGTDLKCYRRGHPVLLSQLPSPFGHEFAGTVATVGEGVTQFTVGDRVVAANSAPCGTCFYCQHQQPNLCDNLMLLNGAYAEYLILPAPIVAVNTHRLPNDLPFELAAFTEPLAVAMRGVLGVGVQAGDSIAIMGLGPIGQLMVAVAKQQGAHVTAFARSPMKLAMAQTWGRADAVVSMAEGLQPEAWLAHHSPHGKGFDVVIEAIGLPETWEAAVAMARRGGKVHWFAGCTGGSTVTLSTQRLHYDEITLYSLFHHTPEHVAMAFNALASGAIDPTPLISQRMGLAHVPQALHAMEQGEAFKVAITP